MKTVVKYELNSHWCIYFGSAKMWNQLQWLDQKMFFGSKYVYTRYGSDEEVVVRDDDEVVLSASDDESDDGEVSQQDEDNNK